MFQKMEETFRFCTGCSKLPEHLPEGQALKRCVKWVQSHGWRVAPHDYCRGVLMCAWWCATLRYSGIKYNQHCRHSEHLEGAQTCSLFLGQLCYRPSRNTVLALWSNSCRVWSDTSQRISCSMIGHHGLDSSGGQWPMANIAKLVVHLFSFWQLINVSFMRGMLSKQQRIVEAVLWGIGNTFLSPLLSFLSHFFSLFLTFSFSYFSLWHTHSLTHKLTCICGPLRFSAATAFLKKVAISRH